MISRGRTTQRLFPEHPGNPVMQLHRLWGGGNKAHTNGNIGVMPQPERADSQH